MANLIQLKRSATPGKVPTIADLEPGELAVNTYDGRVFMEQNDGTPRIIEIGLRGGTAVQNVFYVSKSGSDENDGKSLDKSKLTIRSAIEATRTTHATATATIDTGAVDSITVTNGGEGYGTSLAAVSIDSKTSASDLSYSVVYNIGTSTAIPPVGIMYRVSGVGTAAYNGTFMAVASSATTITLKYLTDPGAIPGSITGVTLTVDPPVSRPTVTIFGSGVGATAVANTINGQVTGIVVTNGGSGYDDNTTVHVSQSPTNSTIFVKTGDYTELNPMFVPAGVSIVGDSLRTVSVRPAIKSADIFWVNSKSYFTEMTYRSHTGFSEPYPAAFSYPKYFLSNAEVVGSGADAGNVRLTLGFNYDKSKCARDTGLIVDSLALDMAFPTANKSQTTFAGIQYWNQSESAIPGEEIPTIRTYKYIRDLAAKIVVEDTSGTRYQVAVSQDTSGTAATSSEQDLLKDEFNLILDIIKNGTVGVTDRIVPNGINATGDSNILNASAQLQANKSYLQAEATAYIRASFPGTSMDVASFGSKTGSGPYLVTLNFSSQAVAPVVGSYYVVAGNGTSTYNGSYRVVASTTTSITLSYPTDPGTWGSGTTTVSAYNIATCERDVGYLIDSICFDITYGGNKQAIQSGTYYYSYSDQGNFVDKEKSQTAAAYRYIKTLVEDVITNTAVSNPYQTAVSQNTGGVPATSAEVTEVEALVENIVNIIINGPSAAPAFVPISLTSGTTNQVYAAERLLSNKNFIKAEVLAYVQATVPFQHPFYSGDNITVRGLQGMTEINNGYVLRITNATRANPVRLTFDKGHVLNNATAMNLSDIAGMSELNGRRVYASYVDNLNVDLYNDPALTDPVDGTSYTAYSTVTFNISSAASPVQLDSGTWTVTFTIPSQTSAPPTGISYVIAGNSNSNYNGSFTAISSTTTSITLSFDSSPGTYGTGTTSATTYGEARPDAHYYVRTNPVVTAGSFVKGLRYEIRTAGTTNYTLIGAANNTVGTIFTATGAGSGTGTAFSLNQMDLYADTQLSKPINGTVGSGFTSAVANTGYVGAGYTFTSPYVHNCSSITSKGTGMRVDGSRAAGLRSMVLDSFTQLNEGGTGIEMVNRGYAQLVSIFTICTDKSIVCKDGGFCSITNSNSSFGRYGLIGDGLSEALYRGTTNGVDQTGRTIVLDGLNDRPNYGDAMALTSNLTVTDATMVAVTATPNNVGSGYLPNDILTVSAGTYGSFSTAPAFKVTSVKVVGTPVVNTGGTSGWVTGDRITFSTGFTTPAVLEVVATAGAIDSFVIVNAGVKYTAGSGTNVAPDSVSGSGNAVTVDLDFGVNTVEIQTSGDVTTVPPNPVATTGGLGSNATLDVVYSIRTEFDTNHFFIGGETITFSDVAGMEDLNGQTYYIKLTGEGNIVDLHEDVNLVTGVDITQFSTYSSGGVAQVVDYYTVIAATEELTGQTSTVEFEVPIRRPIPDNTPVTFHQRSVISSSSHTFEFIGSGNDLATATPESGAYPIQENEVLQLNGGAVYFTSTDQQGDFRIGTELVINRDTGTISGRTFNKSLFAVLTPYILALEG